MPMPLRATRTILLAALALATVTAFAQVSGKVRNAHGDPVPSATIADMAGNQLAISASDGRFTLSRPPRQIEVTAPHYVN